MWGGGQYSNLFYQRSIYYEAPGQANGPQQLAEMQAPLELDPQPVTLAEFRSVAFTSKRDGNSEIYSMGGRRHRPDAADRASRVRWLPGLLR